MMCRHGTETQLQYSVRQNNDWDKWKTIKVDSCISDLITELRSKGIKTLGSCCGHFNYCGSVAILIKHVGLARSLGYEVVCYWRRSIHGDYQLADVLQKNNCDTCKFHKNDCHCTCHEVNSLAGMLADMPNNMKDNFTHGSNRFTIKNEKRKEPSISQCFDNDIRLSSETHHSLIKWESENL